MMNTERARVRSRRAHGGTCIAGALLLAVAASISAVSMAATPLPALTAEQQAIQDSWSERGVWLLPKLGFSGFRSEAEYLDPAVPERFPPPLNAEARAFRIKVRKTLAEEGRALFNPPANCMPVGVPYLLAHPTAFEIQFSSGRAMMLYENKEYRLIYTDGRGHPEDFVPGFFGHSIGHWSGNSFVVDTVGLRGGDKMQIEPHIPFTSAMHVVERWTPDGPDRIKVEVTMTDPGIMTRPWVVTNTMVRHRDDELVEAVCVENNRNFTDAQGNGVVQVPGGNARE